MYSAFGVEHGDIQKGIPGIGASVTRLGEAMGSGSTKAGQSLGRAGSKSRLRAKKELNVKVPGSRKMKPKANLQPHEIVRADFHNTLGAAQTGLGRKARSAGKKMTKNPGAAGGTALGVGAGAAGLGAGGYAMGRKKNGGY